MEKKNINKSIDQRKYKITGLFIILLVGMSIFLLSVLKTISSERRIPSHHSTIHDRSFRGDIISADNYTLSASQKTYQAVIRGESIDPQKKEVFVKLFSIYSGISEEDIRKKFKDRKGRTLGFEDIRHYQKIVKALVLTDEIMGEIDEVIGETL